MTPFQQQIRSEVGHIIRDAAEFGDTHTIDGVARKAIVHASGFSRDSKVVAEVDALTSLSLIVMEQDMARPPVGSLIELDGETYHVFDVKRQGVGAWRATLQRVEG